MEVYTLINKYYLNNPNGHFFDKDTLKFFGERISEMRVLKHTEIVRGRECYVLSTYQHNSPCKNKRAYHYFDKETFEFM